MSYKKFLTIYFLILLIFLSCIALLLFYLSQIFEHNSYETIAKRQIANHSIYGSAFNENYFSYRLAMIEIQRPEILAIGSSRVGQLKQKYFNTSFYTAANGANTINEMKQFIQEVLKIYKPKMIILGIDPWWFNPKFPNQATASYQKIQGNEINTEKIKNAIKMLFERKIPFSLDFFTQPIIQNPFSSYDSLGLRAVTYSDGSFVDGSYLYASTLYQLKTFNDQNFKETLNGVQNGNYLFAHSNKIALSRIQDLDSILHLLKKEKIETFIFIAPVAHRIFIEMTENYKNHYGYLFSLFEIIKSRNIYNYFNPALLPESSECEFYDGFHGGDVIYARILLDIAKQNLNFAQYLNLPTIHSILKTRSGYASSEDYIKNFKEGDFLKLGCIKH